MIGILIMVKNEQDSIVNTINSTRNHIKHVIVYDTGSTDNTIDIIRRTCLANNQTLYLKQGVFETFPISRNMALEFAETVPVKYLLLMDAGDELRCKLSKKKLFKVIETFPANFGLVNQQWLTVETGLQEHYDIRFVKNNCGSRYDTDSPVHEVFKNVTSGNIANMNDLIILYQDRTKYGLSTNKRFKRDIELLLAAKPTKRNLYFLAQSYMSIDDYENGYKYNKKSAKVVDNHIDNIINESVTYNRIGYCAMMCKKDEDTIFKYLHKSIKLDPTFIDPYIYILKVCIDKKLFEKALPLIDTVISLNKNKSTTLINHEFYDYTRWHLVSVICLFCKLYTKGIKACKKAIIAKNHPNDIHNLELLESHSIVSGVAKN